MRRSSAAACLLLAAESAAALGLQQPAPALTVAADARVELVSTIARLAGFAEYNEPVASSPYSAALDRRFAPFREHPAVRRAQELRARAGISHDALASLALHLAPENLTERFDFVAHPGRLAERWRPEDARELAALARDFASETGFAEFFAEHAELYRASAERLSVAVAAELRLDWFDAYLGEKPGVTFRLIPALLIGSNNFGVGVRLPDGTEELAPCLGVWQWDAAGLPLWDAKELGWLVPHELCHSYANPLVDAHFAELARVEDALFPRVASLMRPQAYGDWRIVLRESLTRACVLRYLLATRGKEAAEQQALADVRAGFAWVPELARLLARYEAGRERFPTLAAFMPEVVAFFGELGSAERAREAQRPRLVALDPANGAADVPPGRRTLSITFDRPMRSDRYSLVGGGPSFPEIAGAFGWDAESRVLSVEVELAPEREYRFWLNSATARGFQSREGVSLDPLEVVFRTGSR